MWASQTEEDWAQLAAMVGLPMVSEAVSSGTTTKGADINAPNPLQTPTYLAPPPGRGGSVNKNKDVVVTKPQKPSPLPVILLFIALCCFSMLSSGLAAYFLFKAT